MIEIARTAARVVLGVFLLVAGVAHLVIPDEFLAQVPPFLPEHGRDTFPGNTTTLDTDGARAVRLLFQSPLVASAIWSSASWPLVRRARPR